MLDMSPSIYNQQVIEHWFKTLLNFARIHNSFATIALKQSYPYYCGLTRLNSTSPQPRDSWVVVLIKFIFSMNLEYWSS